jgi:hypothetical protein
MRKGQAGTDQRRAENRQQRERLVKVSDAFGRDAPAGKADPQRCAKYVRDFQGKG